MLLRPHSKSLIVAAATFKFVVCRYLLSICRNVIAFKNMIKSRSRQPDLERVTPSAVKVYTKDELREFMSVFPDLVRDITFLECYQVFN